MLDWLSGKVPGGFPLLFFIIVSTNLALFYLYKYSRLFSKSSYLQKLNKINGAIISVYVILWLLLRPPTPPKALLFLPFQVNDTVDFAYSEALEEYIGCKDIHGYFIYPWNNFYKTADPDSIGIPLYRLRLVQKMEIETVLSGSIHENKLELFIMQSGIKISEDQSRLKSNSFMETAGLVLTILKSKLKIENPNSLCESLIDDKQIRILSEAKQALAGESYPVHAPQAGEGIAAFDGLRAEIDLKKGIQELKRKKKQNEGRSSSLLIAEDNPYFNELRQILKPYQENNKETSEMNRILGEAYLYEQKYEYAEYFLKKALMQKEYPKNRLSCMCTQQNMTGPAETEETIMFMR